MACCGCMEQALPRVVVATWCQSPSLFTYLCCQPSTCNTATAMLQALFQCTCVGWLCCTGPCTLSVASAAGYTHTHTQSYLWDSAHHSAMSYQHTPHSICMQLWDNLKKALVCCLNYEFARTLNCPHLCMQCVRVCACVCVAGWGQRGC